MNDCAAVTILMGAASLRIYFHNIEEAFAAADALSRSVSVNAVMIHNAGGEFAGQLKGGAE